ncbi:MAG: hypothetical protein U9Q62_11745 [Campylobacterota bacterium]|nr:hypothetical protein [Campylobacterota bacterium]
MYNIFGSDPAYTSSLFSRNQYRQDVKAYKVGGTYTIIKGLKVLGSYANYGKSKTVNSSGWTPTTDAYEVDVCLKYKPDNAWDLRLCNAIRSSEYDSYGDAERKMNHIRVIAAYTF